jgi:hypothetical protein
MTLRSGVGTANNRQANLRASFMLRGPTSLAPASPGSQPSWL